MSSPDYALEFLGWVLIAMVLTAAICVLWLLSLIWPPIRRVLVLWTVTKRIVVGAAAVGHWLLTLPTCRHVDDAGVDLMYRERRPLGEIPDVMHMVCPRCGYAVVAVDRTVEEHHAAKAAGAIRQPHAQPQTPAQKLRAVAGGKGGR